jgi:8-oxo-dGTP diphosphatase
MIQVFEQKPDDFSPSVEISAVYVNVNGKLLLLELSSEKPEPGAFGVPAGKLERGEAPLKGAKRELQEETGIDLPEDQFRSLGKLYMRKPSIDYAYHLFSVHLTEFPAVRLSCEHTSYKWVLISETKELPLMQGAHPALDFYSSCG